jgi:Domain of unknown function (DUF4129)
MAGPIAALAGVLALVGIAAAQDEISPDQLLERIQRARELAREEGARVDEVRATLGLPVEVTIGDWTVVLEPDPVLQGLSGDDASTLELAAQRLDALEASLTDALAADAPDAARIASALSAAYAGTVPPRPDAFQAVLSALGDVLGAILQRVGDALAGAGNVQGWVVLLGIAGSVLVVLLRARLVPDRVSTAGRAARSGSGAVDWAAAAEAALRAGDLHEAVRALYLAMLAVLAGRGIVADAPALTAGETRFAVQRVRPAIFPAIARATESYERVVYGGATPDQRDVEHLREATAQARRP